ncbi:TPA: helix-turn-helix transcriptional regulator, partial [Mannheimia haemolytica]|nr:helix-turn-helix transcriptional regulator [Mannheimia haemolytica]
QNGESVWVKRIRKEWDYIELISDNESYRPIQITAEEAQNLQIIGQVVHIGHSLV